MKTFICSIALASTLALAAPAEAKVYRYTIHTGVQTVTTSAALKLNEAGSNIVSFTLAAPALVAIEYSAPCSPPVAGWVSVAIVVDNIEIGQTAGNGDVFCQGSQLDVASKTVAVNLAAGKHKVQVTALSTTGTAAFIDDSSLLIFD